MRTVATGSVAIAMRSVELNSVQETKINNISQVHQPLLLRSNGAQSPVKNSSPESIAPRAVLDGFILLESTGMSFPDDGRQAILNGKKFSAVVEPDLVFFTGLIFLDISENFLDLACFGSLPRLKELRMADNQITEIIDLKGFPKLQYLDLSYNFLTVQSVQELCHLPMLRELDICGNNLGTLPTDMYKFPCLEKIVLEQNKIDDNNVLVTLSYVSTLRIVLMAYNFLTQIPQEACQDEHSFRYVDNSLS